MTSSFVCAQRFVKRLCRTSYECWNDVPCALPEWSLHTSLHVQFLMILQSGKLTAIAAWISTDCPGQRFDALSRDIQSSDRRCRMIESTRLTHQFGRGAFTQVDMLPQSGARLLRDLDLGRQMQVAQIAHDGPGGFSFLQPKQYLAIAAVFDCSRTYLRLIYITTCARRLANCTPHFADSVSGMMPD